MGKQYSIYDAKAKLSELIRFVKKSGRVTITERGKPVAQVIPFSEGEVTLEEKLKELIQSGHIVPAKLKPADIEPIAKRPGSLRRFLESRD